MFRKLKKLFKDQDAAHKATEKEVSRLYPRGTIVRFAKGRTYVVAEVLSSHSWRDEHTLRVRNIHTLKEYSATVSPYNLPEILETPK